MNVGNDADRAAEVIGAKAHFVQIVSLRWRLSGLRRWHDLVEARRWPTCRRSKSAMSQCPPELDALTDWRKACLSGIERHAVRWTIVIQRPFPETDALGERIVNEQLASSTGTEEVDRSSFAPLRGVFTHGGIR